jgi:nitrogen fixation-related uncharacterized protein
MVFFWAVKNDQFEDLEGPAHSILFDDVEQNTSRHTPAEKKSTSSKDDDRHA